MITSPDNQKLKLARKLADRRWRVKERAFVTEGEDLLAAGLRAGATPRAVLVDPDSEIEGEPVESELLAGASSLGSGTRVIAIWPLADGLAVPESGLVVYLEGVGDPGNVGAIVRSAHALGAAAVLSGAGSADPWSPRATRASMGSIFGLPVIEVSGPEATPAPRIGLVAAGGEPAPAALAALAGGGTLCLGAEREGLTPSTLELCAKTATIALADGVDSLNVAAAAAIALERIHSAAVETGPGKGADDG